MLNTQIDNSNVYSAMFPSMHSLFRLIWLVRARTHTRARAHRTFSCSAAFVFLNSFAEQFDAESHISGGCHSAMNLDGYYANLSYIHQFHSSERYARSHRNRMRTCRPFLFGWNYAKPFVSPSEWMRRRLAVSRVLLLAYSVLLAHVYRVRVYRMCFNIGRSFLPCRSSSRSRCHSPNAVVPLVGCHSSMSQSIGSCGHSQSNVIIITARTKAN